MTGTEWLVEAGGCEPARLRDQPSLTALFDDIVRDLKLVVVGTPAWHVFPGPGGITGVYLLAESHLTVHTFPEHGTLCLNLFCCKPRREWDFRQGLSDHVGATDVTVRHVERRLSEAPAVVI